MASYISSWYQRTVDAPVESAPLSGDVVADVAIIGAGMAGLTAALELLRRGKTVVLLEGNRIGWGASGRNGGLVAPGYALSLEDIEKRVGKADAARLYHLSQEGVAIVRENIAALKIDGALMTPGFILASRFGDGSKARRYAARFQQEFGRDVTVLTPDLLEQHVLTPGYKHAVNIPDSLHIQPLNYCLGLAREIIQLGGSVYQDSRVTAINNHRGGKRLHTATGTVSARQVLVTTGGYTRGLLPELDRTYVPIATYIILSKPAPRLLAHAIRTPKFIADDRHANDYYRLVDAGQRLLWGGRVSLHNRPPEQMARRLLHNILSLYPQLAGLEVDMSWTGLMSYARHHMPQIGRLPSGVWFATAFGGHGLNTTALAGRLMAEGITGESDRYRCFAPFGLDWTGGPLGLMAAQSTYWYFKIKDTLQEKGLIDISASHK